MMAAWVLIRAIHFASCLLLVGVWAFDRFIMARMARLKEPSVEGAVERWQRFTRGMMWLLLPAILLSGAGWLACVASNMSGLPWRQSIRPGVLSVVWSETTFGAAWKWRVIFWAATVVFSVPAGIARGPALMREIWAWGALAASGALAGALTWAGHGLTGPPWHRAADVVHLVAAGVWPATLVPLLWMLRATRAMDAAAGRYWRKMLVRRFSIVSVFVVAALAASGVVNGLYLVGSVHGLMSTAYGRLLMVKVLLFLAMVGLGAMNLARWRPRLSHAAIGGEARAESAGRWIRWNVLVELAIAGAIVVIVAVLGLLPPPMR